MSLDFPAAGAALWGLSDATGIRPEYALPVMWVESNFNPGIVNGIGCTGLLQLCPFAATIPAGYAGWSASQQIAQEITPRLHGLVTKYGPLRSGTRLYQANFLPGTLPKARALDDIVTSNAAILQANPGFDLEHKGFITVRDLARAVAKAADNPAVKQAIAQTYALRPGETPNDPVFGDDYPWYTRLTPAEKLLAAAAALSVGALGFVAAREYGYL